MNKKEAISSFCSKRIWRKVWYLVLIFFYPYLLHADEGMWMLSNLNKKTRKAMKEMGLKMSADQLYNTSHPSLKDAVVNFGNFCSGVVVSEDGLVFTNHHCGFSCVQQHSSVEHDYLKDGFVANSRKEELPNPELFVSFLQRTENVTSKIQKAITSGMTEAERDMAVDSMMVLIKDEVSAKDSTLVGIVDAYYGGNEFWLSVYRNFYDVRLVFAPPSSIGKFGWDTDNWMWPRHTGDFCVFRIYADKENCPAKYSPDNVPYHPKYVVPIALDGYKEGSFCMTMGYPGATDRYLSSYGIEEMMNGDNQAKIDIREVKQDIWQRGMKRSDSIRVKYAEKYDQSSNYWKYSIGANMAIRKLKILEKRRQAEDALQKWIQNTPSEREKLKDLMSSLKLNYESRKEENRALAYFIEAFFNGLDLVQIAMDFLEISCATEPKQVWELLQDVNRRYANYDVNLEKKVFAAMLKEYRSKVEKNYLPKFYQDIDTLYGGNEKVYVDSLYANSLMASSTNLEQLLESDSVENTDDQAFSMAFDLYQNLVDIQSQMSEASDNIKKGERELNAAMRRMYADRNYYPDANSTMRLSFGSVGGYSPYDGVDYGYYTTVKGILEKVKKNKGDSDFDVQPEILSLMTSGDFGHYADEKGDMKVCFISNNDITGGNSGSAMFNAKGELLGLAFDGNWEAMSSEIAFEPNLQRCIGVDIRYILFIIEKYGKASRLIQELKFADRK